MGKEENAMAAAAGVVSEYTVPAPERALSESPAESEIAELAYSYWEARGGQGGSAEDDWLQAEQALKAAREL